MPTFETTTLAVTIDAPFATVTADMTDPRTHPEWATEFFAGPLRAAPNGSFIATIPAMGGDVQFKVDADPVRGVFDMYLAPMGVAFSSPVPVRVIPNGSGATVLWTLTRYPGMTDAAWQGSIESVSRELQTLKKRFEQRA